MKSKLKTIASMDMESEIQFEAWDAPSKKYWPSQKALLQPRIAQAAAIYDALIRQARHGVCGVQQPH